MLIGCLFMLEFSLDMVEFLFEENCLFGLQILT